MTDVARTELGRIAVSRAALGRLVVRAAEQVDGARVIRPRRSLRIALEGGAARVTLELAARRGKVLPDLARAVQAKVTEALETMLEVRVDAVDVSVEEVEH